MAKTLANSFMFTVDDDKDQHRAVIDDWGRLQILNICKFMNGVFVDIREWYTRLDGQRLPTKKGVTMTVDEWAAVCDSSESVNEAISTLHTRMLSGQTP